MILIYVEVKSLNKAHDDHNISLSHTTWVAIIYELRVAYRLSQPMTETIKGSN